MSVPSPGSQDASAMYLPQYAHSYYGQQQLQYPGMAAAAPATYGGMYAPAQAQSPTYGGQAMYQQQQGYGSNGLPQPGTMAYTKRTTADGNIVYQPVIAQEVMVQTAQGMVKTIQYVPTGTATSASPATSYGVQSSQLGYPSHAQAPNSAQLSHVPGVAYDMRTYGDAFGMPTNAKDSKKERKRREKEMEREERERRKAAERAMKKRQEWTGAGRQRMQAENEELMRARERDRRGDDDEDEDEFDEEDEYEPAPSRGHHSRRPSVGYGAEVPEPGYDPAIEAKLAGMGFPSAGRRSRRPSVVGGETVDLTYGGAAYGAGGGIARPPSAAPGEGIMPGGMGGMPGMGGMGGMGGLGAGAGGMMPGVGAGMMPGGAEPGYGGSRHRRVSSRSMRESMSTPGLSGGSLGSAGGLMPGAGMPGGGATYIRSPSGQVVPLGDPGMGASPSRVPISQIPQSPGNALGRGSPYGQPTYGGFPAPGGAMAAAGGMMAQNSGMQANIGQYTAAQAFARQPNPAGRFSAFQSFPIFNDMDEMFDMLPEVPPLPAALVDHDVLFEDWARWMNDLTTAWQAVSQSAGSSALRGVRMLIEAWNHNFFLRRAIYFRFSKVRSRRRARGGRSRQGSRYGGSDFDDDDDDESDSLSSDDDDDEYGDDPYARSRGGSRRGGRRRKEREPTSYRLVCEYIAPSGGAGARGALPPGYPAGYA